MSSSLPSPHSPVPFYGKTVLRAAFVLAVLGWGVGFYSPPIFIYAVVSRTHWPLTWVSAAVTLHFLIGALVVANLPAIYRRLGTARATGTGAVLLALGTLAWAHAQQMWQLVPAALLTGSGWVFLGAAAINTIVSPWYWKKRPIALGFAYNGASIGGVIFAPLWAGLIAMLGFATASLCIAGLLLAIVIPITIRVLPHTPASKAQGVDGEPLSPSPDIGCGNASQRTATGSSGLPSTAATPVSSDPLKRTSQPPKTLWRDRRFLTLAGAMALSLFAQIGLLAQLYGLLAAAWGAAQAGWLMAMVTACSVGGRTLVGHLIGSSTNRRVVAATSYAVQATGTLILMLIGPADALWTIVGLVLFGLGIGNATSLPPLIAQQEFSPEHVPTVVARSVASSQALYAFAPIAFATLLAPASALMPHTAQSTHIYFVAVLAIQCLAIVTMLAAAGTTKKVVR